MIASKLDGRRRNVNMTPAEKDKVYAEIKANTTPVGQCWLWNGAKDKDSYGIKRINGKVITVSRFMLSYHTRESLNLGLDACHTIVCPLKACCNPQHLQWGSHGENMDTREYARVIGAKYPEVTGPKPGVIKVKGGGLQYLQGEDTDL